MRTDASIPSRSQNSENVTFLHSTVGTRETILLDLTGKAYTSSSTGEQQQQVEGGVMLSSCAPRKYCICCIYKLRAHEWPSKVITASGRLENFDDT